MHKVVSVCHAYLTYINNPLHYICSWHNMHTDPGITIFITKKINMKPPFILLQISQLLFVHIALATLIIPAIDLI